MDLLKSQFDRIQQQLAGLSASQKMLSACFVVIIVMTVAMWGRYAAVPEMEPLVEEALSPEELRAVKRQLKGSDIPFRIVDGRVEVPSERWAEAAADLTFSQALPKSTKIDFQALVKDMNPFAPLSTTEAQFNNFNQLRLAEVISNYPGVASAQVFVDKTDRVRIGGGVKPSATVNIAMKPGAKAQQRLVDAAAHFIAGSHAGLSWQRVSVVVDGMLQRVRDPNAGGGAGGGTEHLETVERYEKAVESKVLSYFRNIPQMSVSVSFVVNAESKHTRSHSYDKENLIHKPVEENEKTLESNTPLAPSPAEPGALPNIGMSVASGGGSGGQAIVTESDVKTKSQLLVGDEITEIVTPAGIGTPVAAAVQIPRSYIVDVIKHERGAADANAGEPDAQAIQARFNQEMLQIRGMVRRLVRLKKEDEEAVIVSMYTDMLPVAAVGGAPGAAAAQGFSTASVAAVAGAHSREILLGGLAVLSLFMVSMMVRKGNPLPAAATIAMPALAMPVLDASESLAGEVSEGKSMLDAMELDEDAVRAQQMLDQVSSMVEDNPDAAAGLVKRWLNRS